MRTNGGTAVADEREKIASAIPNKHIRKRDFASVGDACQFVYIVRKCGTSGIFHIS